MIARIMAGSMIERQGDRRVYALTGNDNIHTVMCNSTSNSGGTKGQAGEWTQGYLFPTFVGLPTF